MHYQVLPLFWLSSGYDMHTHSSGAFSIIVALFLNGWVILHFHFVNQKGGVDIVFPCVLNVGSLQL